MSLVPPPELIVENGIGIGDYQRIAADFCKVGEGVTGNMIRQGFLQPGYVVLDVGCGLGRLARPLTTFLSEASGGRYFGLDVTASSIAWCTSKYRSFPHFQFIHCDVFNNEYSKQGASSAADYEFPFAAEKFDYLWSTSLFTHMQIHEVDNYLGEMSRVMKRGAKCWNTFLIVDHEAEKRVLTVDPKKSRWYLPHRVEGGFARNIDNPESQIAFLQDRVLELYEKHGLNVEDIRYGPWSGRTENVRAGGQDVLIASKN